eukprot:8602-Amphidinium_carterae.3
MCGSLWKVNSACLRSQTFEDAVADAMIRRFLYALRSDMSREGMRTLRRYVDATWESPPPMLEDGSEAAAPPPESVPAVPLFGREAAPGPEVRDTEASMLPSSMSSLPRPSESLLPSSISSFARPSESLFSSSMSSLPRPSTSLLPSSMSSVRPSSSLAGEARSGAPHPDELAAVRPRTERPFRGAETLARTPQEHEHYWIDAAFGDIFLEVENGIVAPGKLPHELKKLFLEGSRVKQEAAIKDSLRPLSEKEARLVELRAPDRIINSWWLDV